MATELPRWRAYVQFRVEDPVQVASDIYDEYGIKGDDDYVVVRADVVENGDYNLVVPIDAADKDRFEEVIGWLQELAGDATPAVLKVAEYQPAPPHNAHGFVTGEEFEEGDHDDMGPGRIPNSPGANAWG